MVFVVSRYKLLIWSQQRKELHFFLLCIQSAKRHLGLEDWQIISLFCVCDLTVYYNTACIPMNNSACVCIIRINIRFKELHSRYCDCVRFFHLFAVQETFLTRQTGCRFCSEPPPCKQKMPSLCSLPQAAELWDGWISFTQQLFYYSDGAHLPTRSLHVWTTAILVSLRSSDLTAILDYFKQAAQKQIYTTSLSLYMLYCTPSSSQHPV